MTLLLMWTHALRKLAARSVNCRQI